MSDWRSNIPRVPEPERVGDALPLIVDWPSSLIQGFSHVLRTPLTVVRVSVSNLCDAGFPDSERGEQATLALAHLEQLSRVVDEVLDMMRIGARAIHVQRQWVTPAQVVEAALASRPALSDRHDVTIDADDRTLVDLDPRLTSQALLHLLDNASWNTHMGSRIEVTARASASGFYASVTDRGPNLDPQDLDRMFEPFYKGSPRSSRLDSGMGLAITRGLLEPQGGRVWGANATSGGAIFTIGVPASTRVVAIGGEEQ